MTLFYKIIYHPFINKIIRNILYPFKSLLPNNYQIPVSGVIKTDNGFGKKILFYSNESCPMARVLFWKYKTADFEFSNVFKHLTKTANVFVDIGANVGYYSLLSASINPNQKIFSFEPSKGPKYFLETNIHLNGFKNIELVNKACSDKNEKIDFFEERNPKYPYLEHHASGIGNTQNTWSISNFSKYTVEGITLDKFCELNNLTEINLMKIDTEGTENQILMGGLNVIQKHRPIMICEVLENLIEKDIQEIIINKLENYSIYQFHSDSKKLSLVADLVVENKDGNNNYFFIPKEKLDLLKPFIN